MEKLFFDQIDLSSVFKQALINGGDFVELFYENTYSNRLILEESKIDQVSSGIDAGIGLRIIYGKQSVYGYTTDCNTMSLLELAAILSKVVAGKLETNSFSSKILKPEFIPSVSKPASQWSFSDKVKVLENADRVARSESKFITQASIGWIETHRITEIANNLGERTQDLKQSLTLYAQTIGQKNGQVQSSFEAQGGLFGLELLDMHPAESIAKESVRRTLTLLDAKPAPAGAMPVVLASEAGGTMVHEAVGHGLEADLACNGLSVYKDQLGKTVASPLVNIIDDGTMPTRRGSYSFDDEGTPSRKNTLIENGILKSYMTDRLSEIKFDLKKTGNGRRESYRHKPIVRMTNTYLAPGKDNPEKILTDTKMGLFVKSMGGGQVNTVTGDFVFAVTEGYLIRNGEIAEPVRGATLTGNGPLVLKSLDRVGSDLGFAIGTCGKDGQGVPVTDAQPTIRIPEMVVGGEVPMKQYWTS